LPGESRDLAPNQFRIDRVLVDDQSLTMLQMKPSAMMWEHLKPGGVRKVAWVPGCLGAWALCSCAPGRCALDPPCFDLQFDP